MRLNSIQALRAAAVLLVFAYHVSVLEAGALASAGSGERPLLGGLWANGYAGVDLFFVISGFIMVYVTGEARAGRPAAGAFLFARAARIYPLWWLFSTVAVIYLLQAYGVPYNVHSASAGVDKIAEAPWTRLALSYALLPQAAPPILSIGWTLIHELYFYAVFALLLLAPRRRLPPLLALWAALVVAGAALGLSAPVARNPVELVFHPMTLEFLLGAGVALLVVDGRRWRPGLVFAAGAVGLACGLALAKGATPEMLQWGRVAWFALPCAALVYGYTSLDVGGRARSPAVFVDLGDWSYAFYLSHMLTLLALQRLLLAAANALESSGVVPGVLILPLRLGAPGLADNIFFLLAGLTLSCLVAWGSHTLFERPVLRMLGRARASLFSTPESRLRPRPIRAAIW